MMLGKKQFLSLIIMSCGLWTAQVSCKIYFKNDTAQDVFVEFGSSRMKEDKNYRFNVKAKDSLEVNFSGNSIDGVPKSKLSYAYAVPHQIPLKKKTTDFFKLSEPLPEKLNYYKNDLELIFTASDEEHAPQIHAALREKSAAPSAPMSLSDKPQVSCTAGCASVVSKKQGCSAITSGCPKRITGSSCKTCCD